MTFVYRTNIIQRQRSVIARLCMQRLFVNLRRRKRTRGPILRYCNGPIEKKICFFLLNLQKMNNYNSEHFVRKKIINTHSIIGLCTLVCRHHSTATVFSRSSERPERPGSLPSWHLRYKSSIDIIHLIESKYDKFGKINYANVLNWLEFWNFNSLEFFYLAHRNRYLWRSVGGNSYFFLAAGTLYMCRRLTVEFIMSLKGGFLFGGNHSLSVSTLSFERFHSTCVSTVWFFFLYSDAYVLRYIPISAGDRVYTTWKHSYFFLASFHLLVPVVMYYLSFSVQVFYFFK